MAYARHAPSIPPENSPIVAFLGPTGAQPAVGLVIHTRVGSDETPGAGQDVAGSQVWCRVWGWALGCIQQRGPANFSPEESVLYSPKALLVPTTKMNLSQLRPQFSIRLPLCHFPRISPASSVPPERRGSRTEGKSLWKETAILSLVVGASHFGKHSRSMGCREEAQASKGRGSYSSICFMETHFHPISWLAHALLKDALRKPRCTSDLASETRERISAGAEVDVSDPWATFDPQMCFYLACTVF